MRTNRGPFSPITGPESGYQGASRGGNRGVASSGSSMVVANTRIIILTITATSDIGVKLCLGKLAIDTRRCPVEPGGGRSGRLTGTPVTPTPRGRPKKNFPGLLVRTERAGVRHDERTAPQDSQARGAGQRNRRRQFARDQDADPYDEGHRKEDLRRTAAEAAPPSPISVRLNNRCLMHGSPIHRRRRCGSSSRTRSRR